VAQKKKKKKKKKKTMKITKIRFPKIPWCRECNRRSEELTCAILLNSQRECHEGGREGKENE
jgi:hypothetical protein